MEKQIHIQLPETQFWDWKDKANKAKMTLKDYVISRVEGEC
jgi:hypothetical protein